MLRNQTVLNRPYFGSDQTAGGAGQQAEGLLVRAFQSRRTGGGRADVPTCAIVATKVIYEADWPIGLSNVGEVERWHRGGESAFTLSALRLTKLVDKATQGGASRRPSALAGPILRCVRDVAVRSTRGGGVVVVGQAAKKRCHHGHNNFSKF